MDKKAKLLDRLQNLAIAVLSLSFLFLLPAAASSLWQKGR